MSADNMNGEREAAFGASFVPRTVALSAAKFENARESDEPSTETFEAAVCVVDISGFTPITERFEKSGPEGVEILSGALASVFEPLIERVTASGGEVASMPGDAVVAYWPGDASGADAALNAAVTAMDAALDDLRGATLADGTELSIHAGLSVGPISLVQLGGGETDRRFYFLTGDAVYEAFDLSDISKAGQLFASPACAARLDGIAAFSDAKDGWKQFETLLKPAVAAAPADGAHGIDVHHYLQRSLRARLSADHQKWLAEYRRLTVLFININGASIVTDEALAQTHMLANRLETVIREHGGDTQGIVVTGDKTEIVALFGLPMLARDDDPHRALSAAKRIERELGASGLECCIGICTGQIFCGQVGTDIWRAYTVHGATMNRTARVAGLGRPGVTIDEATLRGAGQGVDAVALPPTPLRGVETPVNLYSLSDVRRETRSGHRDQVFGREIEMKRIHQTIDKIAASSGPAQTMIVQGSPGIGKSMILRDGALYAAKSGLRVVAGEMDTQIFAQPFAGWRGVFRSLFNIDRDTSADDGLARIEGALPLDERARNRMPLLTPLLPFAIPNNQLTAQIYGEARAESARELMLSILETAARDKPLVIMLDDFERMDTASLRLAAEVAASDAPIQLLIGVRTETERAKSVIDALLADNADHINLADIDEAAIIEIIQDAVDADEIAPVVAEFIQNRASGNPFFAREIAMALKEQGTIVVRDRRCALAGEIAGFSEVEFPETIERIIVSRIDRLNTDVQFTLKIASVMGRQFELKDILGVHPLNPVQMECTRQVEELSERNLTPLAEDMPDQTYFFKHVITHDTVYGLLPFAARRELHESAAQWIEKTVDEPLKTHAAVLAHHYMLAEKPNEALRYLEAAGYEALNASADLEGRELLSRAIDIYTPGVDGFEAERRCSMLFALAEMEMRLGLVKESETRFREGLELLGLRWPSGKGAQVASLLSAAGAQSMRRLTKKDVAASSPVDQKQALLSAGLQKFGYIFFFEDRREEMLLGILHGMNAAEKANDRPAIARTSALTSVVMCVPKFHKWAAFYDNRSAQMLSDEASLTDRSYVRLYNGLYNIGIGNWAQAEQAFEDSIAASREAGERRVELDSISFRRSMRLMRGRFHELPALMEEHMEVAAATNDVQHGYHTRTARGEMFLRHGDIAEADHWLTDARERLVDAYPSDHLLILAPLAATRLLQGDVDEAWRIASEQVRAVAKQPPVGYYTVEAFWHLNGVFQNMIANGVTPTGVSEAELAKMAKDALGAAKALGDSFPSTAPRARVLEARSERLSGKASVAEAKARAAADLARAMETPMELAMAEAELGRNTGLSQTERSSRRAEAERIFAEIGLPEIGARAGEDIAPIHG